MDAKERLHLFVCVGEFFLECARLLGVLERGLQAAVVWKCALLGEGLEAASHKEKCKEGEGCEFCGPTLDGVVVLCELRAVAEGECKGGRNVVFVLLECVEGGGGLFGLVVEGVWVFVKQWCVGFVAQRWPASWSSLSCGLSSRSSAKVGEMSSLCSCSALSFAVICSTFWSMRSRFS